MISKSLVQLSPENFTCRVHRRASPQDYHREFHLQDECEWEFHMLAYLLGVSWVTEITCLRFIEITGFAKVSTLYLPEQFPNATHYSQKEHCLFTRRLGYLWCTMPMSGRHAYICIPHPGQSALSVSGCGCICRHEWACSKRLGCELLLCFYLRKGFE
jgi:hypothetical protein